MTDRRELVMDSTKEKNLVISHEYVGAIFIIISAVGFALMLIFAKFAYEDGANVITVLSLRFLLAVLIL
jgi:hypothetical protein